MAFEVSRLDSVYSSRTRSYPLETIALEMRKGTGTLSKWRELLIASGREVVSV